MTRGGTEGALSLWGGRDIGSHSRHDHTLVEEGTKCGRAQTRTQTSKSQPTNPVFLIPWEAQALCPVLSYHPEICHHLPHLLPPVATVITAQKLCRKKWMYVNFEHLFSIGGDILLNPHHNPTFQMRKLRPREVRCANIRQ